MKDTQPDLNVIAPERESVSVDASFAPLIPKFLANRVKEISTMNAALAAQDFETVRKIAHGAKGAGGTYGFTAVTAMATAIESAAKQGMSTTIEEELKRLSAYLGGVEVIFDDAASGE